MKKKSILSNLESGNQNWLSFGVVIASFVVQIMSLSFGAELFWMTDWKTFLWGTILGSILLSALLCVSGYIGLKMRIPTAVQYGNIFGQVGARIMNLFLLPAGIVWVAWMSDIAANSVKDIFPAVPSWIVVIVICAISVFSAIRGVKGMEQSGYIQAPVVLVLVLLAVVTICIRGFSKGVIEMNASPDESTLSLLDSTVFVVLTWISVIPIFSDFTCNVRATKDMTVGTFVGYGFLNAVMMLAGGVFAMVCGPEYSMVRGFTAGGIPQILVLVVVLLCSWTFNDRSFYSFGLGAGVVLGEKVKSWIPLVVGGIGAAIIAILGIMDYMYPILNVLGCLYAPLLGIYLCKYYALGGLKETSDFSKMIKFDWVPFVPWAVGLTLGLTLKEGQSVVSFIVSFVIYFVMCKVRNAVKNKNKNI